MEGKHGKAVSPSCKKTGDAAQQEEFIEHQGRQTSVLQKQMSVDGKFSSLFQCLPNQGGLWSHRPLLRSLNTEDCGSEHGSSSFLNPPFTYISTGSQYIGPSDTDSLHAENSPVVGQSIACSTTEEEKKGLSDLLDFSALFNPLSSSYLGQSLCSDQGHSLKSLHTAGHVSKHGNHISLNPLCPENSPVVGQGIAFRTAESLKNDAYGFLVQSQSDRRTEEEMGSQSDRRTEEEMGSPVAVEPFSSEHSVNAYRHLIDSFQRPTLSQKTSAKKKTFTGANSSGDMLSKDNSEEFAPNITPDASSIDTTDCMLSRPRRTNRRFTAASSKPGVDQDNTRKMELHEYEHGSIYSPCVYPPPHSRLRHGSITGVELKEKELSDCVDLRYLSYPHLSPQFRPKSNHQSHWLKKHSLKRLHTGDCVSEHGDPNLGFRDLSTNSSRVFTPFITTDSTDSPDCMMDQPLIGELTEMRMIKNCSSAAHSMPGVDQDNTREMEPHATAGPSDDGDSDSVGYHGGEKSEGLSGSHWDDWASFLCSDLFTAHSNRNDTDEGDCRLHGSSYSVSGPTYPQSVAPTVAGPACPQGRPAVIQDSTVCTEGSRTQDAVERCECDALVETSVTAVNYLVTNALPGPSRLQIFGSSDPGQRRRDCLPRSHSVPSLSQINSAEKETFARAESLPDMLLKNSFEEFTPADESDETYRFRCSCPGLYRCSVTGLVFHMDGEGDVVYRVVPWNRRLLAQHHKKPAGPLFDIKCLQQSVCQLHLPHCEICCNFLSVAHVNDEGIDFISPHKITETHVVINIAGFSCFGNVKDENSPPDPVRALVLLFYRPPADPDLTSLLNVLLLPRNVVLQEVLHIRKKLFGDEIYIETSPHCKLHPEQDYTLSTCPDDDSILVQPTEAEFDCDNYDNYFPSFQVSLEKILKHVKLFLRDTNGSHNIWERQVCLTGGRRSCGPSVLNLAPKERLSSIRSSFVDGISGPVLKSLLDRLLEKKVMTDAEGESADVIQNKQDKARFVIDTVRKKGDPASSEMIEFLCEADPFLCEHLNLIR